MMPVSVTVAGAAGVAPLEDEAEPDEVPVPLVGTFVGSVPPPDEVGALLQAL
jgi:hypothetical protein